MKKLRRIGELNEHKHVDAFSKQQYIIYTADNQVDIVEQGREQHDQSMRLIEQCEDGERSDEEEAVSSSSWKGFSEVQDDCRMIATFKKKGWMKLMRYSGKNITQLLTSQVTLMKSQLTMMKNVMTMRMEYMKRRMYSEIYHISLN